jgi:hypothetical protein
MQFAAANATTDTVAHTPASAAYAIAMVRFVLLLMTRAPVVRLPGTSCAGVLGWRLGASFAPTALAG